MLVPEEQYCSGSIMRHPSLSSTSASYSGRCEYPATRKTTKTRAMLKSDTITNFLSLKISIGLLYQIHPTYIQGARVNPPLLSPVTPILRCEGKPSLLSQVTPILRCEGKPSLLSQVTPIV